MMKKYIKEIVCIILLIVLTIVVIQTRKYYSDCPHWKYTNDINGNCFAMDTCWSRPNWTVIPCKSK